MEKIIETTERVFEDIKHIDEFDNEYWLARELQKALGYSQWRRFENTISRAKISSNNSNVRVKEHFANVGKMIILGNREDILDKMPEKIPTPKTSLK